VRARDWSWVGAFVANIRQSELPLPRRVAVAARNIARRVTLRQTCCGHRGQPGC
jgi:hypothetical protein